MMQSTHKPRIPWIDVLRCIGLLEIYIGHYGGGAGALYPFVFSHHVQLFFLCAGFVENLNPETSIVRNGVKKFFSLLLPFYFFALLSMFLTILNNDSRWSDIFPMLRGILAGGVRNHFFAWPTWFISCQFVMSILFSIIRKLKTRAAMVLFGILLCWAAGRLLPYYPSLPYNVDSAFLYLVIYIIGYAAFPFIQKWLEEYTKYAKILWLTGGVAFLYTAFLYGGADVLSLLWGNALYQFALTIVRPLVILWFYILVSFAMQNIKPFALLGQRTLYLCGNEYNVKLFVPVLLGMFGIQRQSIGPLGILFECAFYLAIAYFFLAPWQERFLAVLSKKLNQWRVFLWLKGL
jgi:fucose 4-O-acetylase-like acetyltransferase